MPNRTAPTRGVNPVRLDAAEILRERRSIRRALRRCGVREEDLEDVAEDVIVAAWLAVEGGRYVPPELADPRRALRSWLFGICRNVANHHRESGRVRHEVVTEPAALPERSGLDVGAQVAAREELQRLVRLPPHVRAPLFEVAVGCTFAEAGAALGIPASTAAKRVYIGRRALAKAR